MPSGVRGDTDTYPAHSGHRTVCPPSRALHTHPSPSSPTLSKPVQRLEESPVTHSKGWNGHCPFPLPIRATHTTLATSHPHTPPSARRRVREAGRPPRHGRLPDSAVCMHSLGVIWPRSQAVLGLGRARCCSLQKATVDRSQMPIVNHHCHSSTSSPPTHFTLFTTITMTTSPITPITPTTPSSTPFTDTYKQVLESRRPPRPTLRRNNASLNLVSLATAIHGEDEFGTSTEPTTPAVTSAPETSVGPTDPLATLSSIAAPQATPGASPTTATSPTTTGASPTAPATQ